MFYRKVIRTMDESGKIILPLHFRKGLGLDIFDKVEIEYSPKDMCIIIRRIAPMCIFCKDINDVKFIKNKHICDFCLNAIKNLEFD